METVFVAECRYCHERTRAHVLETRVRNASAVRAEGMRVLVDCCLQHRQRCYTTQRSPTMIERLSHQYDAIVPFDMLRRPRWEELDVPNPFVSVRDEEYLLQQKRDKRLAEQAEKKAFRLLEAKCTAQQWKDWCAEKHIFCTGSKSGAAGIRYELTAKYAYNIYIWLFNKTVGKLCVSVDSNKIPLPDMLLSQKLMIETDEESFIQLANVSGMFDRQPGSQNREREIRGPFELFRTP